jgi:hypothetical protein
MQSFLEMFELVEANFGLAAIVDRIAADAAPDLKPFITQIIQSGYKGGVHRTEDLEKAVGPGNAKKLYDALYYLSNMGVIQQSGHDDYGGHGTYQVSDINQFIGTGGSSLKGARTGVLSRKMLGHGDSQRTRGEFDSRLQQMMRKYPKHAQALQMIFASPVWMSMTQGKPARAEEIAPGANINAVLGALDTMRHEELVGFGGNELTPDTLIKARKFGDAVENDLDRASKKFPQYAALFQKIMGSGAWRRMQAGGSPQAQNFLGIKATGGTFSPDVEQQLQALEALKSMGIVHFEGKISLNTPVSKGASEVSPENAYDGPNKASDAAQAMAGGESKPGTRIKDKDTVVTGQNVMHGGSSQQKMAPGALASAAGMHNDDPTEAISSEWWHAWKMAMDAARKNPTLWENEKWLGQLEDQTLDTLKNIAGQIKTAIEGKKPRQTVKPMLTSFFKIAYPRSEETRPMELWDSVKSIARQVKSLYDGTFKKQMQ